jgi:hypothetical protein
VGTFSGKIYKASLVTAPFTLNLVYEAPDLESINAFTDIDVEVGDDNGTLRRRKKKKAARERRGSSLAVPHSPGEAGGIVETIDNGLSWQDVSDGLPAERKMSSLATYVTSPTSATVYAGMFLNQNDGAPVYVLNFVTDVDEPPPGLPQTAGLSQNYPNPFNPVTNIGYKVATRDRVSLKVYDLLGREIASLVNEVKSPGSYDVTWEATGISSGVYLYRLTAGDFVETRKLVLVR